MAKIPRKAFDNESDYVVEKYGVDFRDNIHKNSNINYFDTVFFSRGWLFNKYKSGISLANYEDSEISITNKFWAPPDFVIKHGESMIESRIKSDELHEKANKGILPIYHHFNKPNFLSIENNISIRFDKVDFDGSKLKIAAQRVTYFDQAATNIAAYKGEKVGGFDLRKYDSDFYGSGSIPKSFDESHLANSLGVACVFEISGEIPVLVPRFRPAKKKTSGQKHAVMSDGAWHCSSSGVFEYKDLNLGLKANEQTSIPLSRLEAGMAREIESEASLQLDEDYTLVPLCLSREIPRAGKPQMFYKAVLNPKKFRHLDDIRIHLNRKRKEEAWEYQDELLYSEKFEEINRNLLSFSLLNISEKFTYEGFANVVFAR